MTDEIAAGGPNVPYCCFIQNGQSCVDPAEFELIFGSRPDDYTHACRAHVGELIPDVVETRVVHLVDL